MRVEAGRRVRHAWAIAWAMALAIGLSDPVAAGQEPATDTDGATLAAVDLRVSIDTVKRRLGTLPPHDESRLFRHTERVDVYALEIPVEVLHGFNVESWTSSLGGRTGGSIAYGAPTHNEMMTAMTPAFWQQRAASMGGFSVGW